MGLVAMGRTFGGQWVVATAEKAAIRASSAENLSPAQPARQGDVVGQFAPVCGSCSQILANRAHARWIAFMRVLIERRDFAAGVGWQAIVAAGFMVDGADDGGL